MFSQWMNLFRRLLGRPARPESRRDELRARFTRIERETLRYQLGDRSVNIGVFGTWRRGSEMHFVVNSRWNPALSGPTLDSTERDEVVRRILEYAAAEGVVPKVTFFEHGNPQQSGSTTEGEVSGDAKSALPHKRHDA